MYLYLTHRVPTEVSQGAGKGHLMGSSFDRAENIWRGGDIQRKPLQEHSSPSTCSNACLIWFNRTDCGYTLHKVRLLSYSHNQSHLVDLYTNEKGREQPQVFLIKIQPSLFAYSSFQLHILFEMNS